MSWFSRFFGDLFKPFVPKGPEGFTSITPTPASVIRDAEGTMGYVPEEMYSAGKFATLGGLSMVGGIPGNFGGSSMLGSILGSAISGGLGLAGGLASSALNYRYQKKLMEKQDAMQRQYAQDAPGLTKAGMEKAGLNPLLSAGGSTSSEPLNPGSGSGVNLSSSMSDMVNAASSFKQAQAANSNAKTQSDVGKSTIQLNRSNIALNDVNSANSIAKTQADIAKTQADIYNNTMMTEAKIKALEYQYGMWKSRSEWAKKHPILSNILGNGVNVNVGFNSGASVHSGFSRIGRIY